MSQLDTLPPSLDVATGEKPTYNIDVSGYLNPGETLQVTPSPSAVMLLQSSNASITGAIPNTPGVSGNLLQVTIDGSKLAPKQSYYMICTFYTTATKFLQCRTIVNVPF